MGYYVAVCEGRPPVMPMDSEPDGVSSWMLGEWVPEMPQAPLEYALDPDYEGEPKAMYEELSRPVMHADVVHALQGAGVDNIQFCEAVVRNPQTGREYRDYKAFNIVGIVACADKGESELMGTSDSEIGDVDFHRLVINESKTGGLLLFRLAESVSAIVVHERVKQAIEAAAIPGFVFYGPGEWSG